MQIQLAALILMFALTFAPTVVAAADYVICGSTTRQVCGVARACPTGFSPIEGYSDPDYHVLCRKISGLPDDTLKSRCSATAAFGCGQRKR